MNRSRPISILVHTVLIALAGPFGAFPARVATGQPVPVTDEVVRYGRAMEGSGYALGMSPLWSHASGSTDKNGGYPWSGRMTEEAGRRGPWVRLLPASISASSNSARPFGTNDGEVWQGKGRTVWADAGVAAGVAGFEIAVRPLWFSSENDGFILSRFVTPGPASRYASAHRSDVDVPQRFGDQPYARLSPGESSVRYTGSRLSLGWTNGAAWIGPAVRNPLILSTHAGGVSRMFVQTERPIRTPAGSFGALWFVGIADGSKLVRNGQRSLSALALAWQPRFAEGLHLGLASVRMAALKEGRVRGSAVLSPMLHQWKGTEPTDPSFGLVAVYARWVMPEDGAEIYGEWGRRMGAPASQLVYEPDRNGAYVLGMRKALLRHAEHVVLVSLEYADVGSSRTRSTLARQDDAADPSWYTHAGVPEGYTHRGQLLGASMGPGSNTAWAGLDWYAPWGRLSAEGWRTTVDADAYIIALDGVRDWTSFEVEVGTALTAYLFAGPLDLSVGASYGLLLNKDYVFENDEPNWSGSVGIRYRPSRSW